MTILVTGARGTLGRDLIGVLKSRGVPARGSGRNGAPPDFAAEWRRADLLSGDGLDAAISGVAAVVHCASDPAHPDDDIRAIGTLIAAARREGARIIYVGIAGIEDAAAVLPYYRAKLACERRLAGSGAAYAICRATQFHPLVAHLLNRLGRGPIQLCPPLQFQPVDPRFVAERLVDHALDGTRGRSADLHGREALTMTELASSWLRGLRRRRLRVPVPAFGMLAAFRLLRQADGDTGGASWQDWLKISAFSDHQLHG